MSSRPPPLILVDGSSYLYRAYYAGQRADMRTSEGLPTGAIRILTSMLRSLRKTYPMSPIAVVFDAPGKTFRDNLYSDYKANRESMPEDLRCQVAPIKEVIAAMGLPILSVAGVEADDVIGTLAAQAESRRLHTLIATGDKDMAQLVDDYVTLMDTMKDETLDHAGVVAKFGVPPEHIADYLALMGDSSDNIPGIPGVGRKTAVGLLQDIGGISAIYRSLDQVAHLPLRGAKALGAKLADHKDLAQLSLELATIKKDVELPLSLSDLTTPQADEACLRELFQRFEFRAWAEELAAGPGKDEADEATKKNQAATYTSVLTEEQLDEWVTKLEQAPLIALDTETTSLNYMEAKLVGISLAVKTGEAAYIPLGHNYEGAPEQLNLESTLERLKPILESARHLKLGQHLKYDINILANQGIRLQGVAQDTMLESYVLNPSAGRHDLDSLAQRHLNTLPISFESLAGKGKKQITFNQVPLEQATPYAAEDAELCLQLHERLHPQLKKTPELLKLYESLDIPLVPILAAMEQQGALVDKERLQQQSRELSARMAELEAQAHEEAGRPFNLGSPKQLQSILFEERKLPVIKKTPKGAPSTAEEVLAELALDYPLPKLLLEYRSLSKLKSTYTDRLPEMIYAATGRLHTSYHQAVTSTGRLSSSDPNLQNIPIRKTEGRRIRQAFVAPPGQVLVAGDYSQIELRIMAHLSGDERLLTAFAHNEDIHRITAAEVFGCAPESVTSEQRRSAKAINFGLIYGMSAYGLSRQLGISRQKAASYIEHYFATYPGVRHYMESIRKQARELGYVETLRGRRLYLPDINSRNHSRQQAAERTAINAPMQGTAADIIKQAMLDVSAWLQQETLKARMIMQVHDELVFEVAAEDLEPFRSKLEDIMTSSAQLRVPLRVETGQGGNWDEAH